VSGPGFFGGFGSLGGSHHGRAGVSGLLNHTGGFGSHGLNRLHAGSHGLLQNRLHQRQALHHNTSNHHLSIGPQSLHGGHGLHGFGDLHIVDPFVGSLIVRPSYSGGTVIYDDGYDDSSDDSDDDSSDDYTDDRNMATSTRVEYLPGEALRMGRRFMKQRSYDRATDAFLAAVLAEPEAGLPKLLFAHALFAAEDYDYAAYAIRRAMDRIDDLNAFSPTLTDLYQESKEFDRLLYKLHHQVERHPIEADGYFILGYFSAFGGDDNAAIDAFDRTLRRSPDDSHAARLRNLARSRTGQSTTRPRVKPKVVYPPGMEPDE